MHASARERVIEGEKEKDRGRVRRRRSGLFNLSESKIRIASLKSV